MRVLANGPKAMHEIGDRLASCLLNKRLDFSGFQPPACAGAGSAGMTEMEKGMSDIRSWIPAHARTGWIPASTGMTGWSELT